MVERIQIEATLRSDFGLQRLSRALSNDFDLKLFPPESHQVVGRQSVRWIDGAFWYEARTGRQVIWLDAPTTLFGSRKLSSGDRFKAGATTVEFDCVVRKWKPDLDRERELLARDDHAAWSIYTDELLLKGDPLGIALAARAGELDHAFELDVSPLVARGIVSLVEQRRLWREVIFRIELDEGSFEAGAVEAVLTHPRAWFVRRVVLDLGQDSELRDDRFLVETFRRVAAEVDAAAGPFLEALHLEGFPAGEALPDLGESVRLSR